MTSKKTGHSNDKHIEPDEYYIGFIIKTKFLKEQSKDIYLSKLHTIQNEFYDKFVNIHYIITHPEIFLERIKLYSENKKGKFDDKLSNHTLKNFLDPILAIFKYNQELKEDKKELYDEWIKVQKELYKPIVEEVNKNKPNKRQEESYVSYEDIIHIRNKLEYGSQERLLFRMYTDICPVRNDLWHTRIYNIKPSIEEKGNFIVLNNKENFLCLQQYKTSKIYGIVVVELPKDLSDEIKFSINQFNREYLFVSPSTLEPYNSSSTFNKWCNKILKEQTGNDKITLTTLRHIYISRKDLGIEKMTLEEKQKIANSMQHSVIQQSKYSWFDWNKV